MREYVPASQGRHVDELFAPVTGEYLPASHKEHTGLFVLLLYDPALQAVQELEPSTEYLPGSQGRQVRELLAPTVAENLPAEQFVHAMLLMLSL